MERQINYILKTANDNHVKFIRLWFTDILGTLKSFAITIDELEDALNEGVRFDASALDGFSRTEENELIALPDCSTFQVLPWRPSQDAVARIFCNIYNTNMTPYEGDSRYLLKRTLEKAAAKGFSFYTGPEIEYFYFKSQYSPEVVDRGGYFDLTPLDAASDLRRDTVLCLEKMGISVVSSHHEGAYSQHEIDLRHTDALSTADNIMTFKTVAKEIAQSNNLYASFMPKPLSDQNGSGMHIHLSIFQNDKNIFFDEKDEYNVSDICKKFISGILKHNKDFFIISNQWINSYKRFVSGYEAPVYNSWSKGSNTSLIRLPKISKNKPDSIRIELRSPDPACNPYLLFSAILAAGLDGIENDYELPEPIENSMINSNTASLPLKGLELPSNLSDALSCFKQSDFCKNTFGANIFNRIIENKIHELADHNKYITDYELDKYLPFL